MTGARRTAATAAVAAALIGCSVSPGAKRLSADHFAFNDAVELAESQEMLLNIVRIRYVDPVKFLAVGTLGSSFSVGGGAAAEVGADAGDSTTLFKPNVAYTESPTLTFIPRGERAFAMNVLSPIPLPVIVMALRATPNIEMEMLLTVAEINGAPDTVGAIGELYRRRLAALVRMADEGWASVGVVREGDDLVPAIVVHQPDQPGVIESLEVLDLTPGRRAYAIRSAADLASAGRHPEALFMSSRSVLEMMAVMARGVETPAGHETAGIVPPIEWFPGESAKTAPFRVSSGPQQPAARYAIRHRGYWFWIAEDDLESKSAFLSLMTHFNVQVGSDVDPRSQPVLTLPIGQ